MKQKLLSFFLLMTLFVGVSVAQEKKVSGQVTALESGAPIQGVSVAVLGKPNATQTDQAGKFSMNVNENSILVFSYIGYTSKQLNIGQLQTVQVQLTAEENALQEVVVTAMGISKDKRALGYATQGLKNDELTRASNTNMATALQGKVSGVEVAPSSGMPGASAKITIRGARSFTGDNSPLYVVDGMPISSASDVSTGNSVSGSDFANRGVDIDPNDIESINILKGQAASALYGMRASNGVILITTKSGKGAQKGKAQITLNSNLSIDKVSILPKLQSIYAQGTKGEFDHTSSNSWGPRIDQLANDPNYGGNMSNAYTDEFGMQEGKYYVPQLAAAGLDPWARPRAYNNAKDFFDVGTTLSNSINVVQGFDKGHYSFTLGNANASGIIPSTGMDRYNAKLSAEAQLSDHFKTGFFGNYVTSKITKQTGANNGIMATVYGAPASYNLAGIPSHIQGDPYTQNNFRNTSGFDNAYWALDNNAFTERSQRFFGNAFLQFDSKLGTDNQKLVLKYQLGTDAYTTNYTDLWGYGHANQFGSIEHYAYTINELNSLATASYSWKINDDFNFDALLGNEIVNKTLKYDYAFGRNFNFPGWNHMDNASIYNASESYRRTRTFGTFGNVSLGWKNMLFLNITGRNDIVSTMPRNNRSFFYPSTSLGFIFTEIDAFKNNVITYGKLRASVAEVGQAGTYFDSYYSTPIYGGGFSSGTPIQYPIVTENGNIVAYVPDNRVYDPNLKPQNTRSYEIGTDLTFFQGLFNVAYTFSRQNVKDQIFPVPLAGSTGSSEFITNGGSIHTNAHELTLQFSPIRQHANWKWDFAFNFSKIDNYVDELAEGVQSIFLGGFVEPQVRASIGEKFPVIYGTSYLRNEAGQIVVNEKGIPQLGEETVIGRVSPDFMLGFNTQVEYKKFRFSAVLDWKQGGQMYSGTSGILDYYGVSQYSADVRTPGTSFMFHKDAVKVAGLDANGEKVYAKNDIQIAAENAQNYFQTINDISESMIYDNSFVKLREVTIGYPVLSKKSIKLDVTAFARNILIWSKFKNLDPESAQGNTNMGGAFERFSLPGTSSYGLGVNLKF